MYSKIIVTLLWLNRFIDKNECFQLDITKCQVYNRQFEKAFKISVFLTFLFNLIDTFDILVRLYVCFLNNTFDSFVFKKIIYCNFVLLIKLKKIWRSKNSLIEMKLIIKIIYIKLFNKNGCYEQIPIPKI